MTAPAPRKLFTLEQANAMLPLVRAIAQDMSGLATDILDRRKRLQALRARNQKNRHDSFSEELEQIEDEIEKDNLQLAEYVQELEALGVEPKSAAEGLLDFPALIDGRVVYLCWKLGEAEVLFWHETDAGIAGRQPLTAGTSAAEPGTEEPPVFHDDQS